MTYIVEETIGPLLDDIEAELSGLAVEPGTQEYVVAFWERVTDLKVLDPAMGSGHFLTKATGYLADAVMERVRELESGSLFDEELVRRTISRECIYGVDVNGMAVELAKLSMWLETLAADQPLAFLDHHLKDGNSLVGSDISAVLSNGDDDDDADPIEDDDAEGMVQSSLFDYFDQVRRQALDHVMDRMGELLAIDNETLDDVHSMETLYADIREDPLYEHLQAMATVHTAGEFGLDVPDDAIERMARTIEDDAAWAEIEATDWFRAARAMADEEGFFHWELEFPAVFFDSDGERLASAGFDAVVGNPPWLNAWTMSEKYPEYRNKLKSVFDSAEELTGHWDLYVPFVIKSLELCKSGGEHSFILPSPVLTEKYATALRKSLLSDHAIRNILSFGENTVFEGVDRQCIIYTLRCDSNSPDTESLRKAKTTTPFKYNLLSYVDHEIWLSRYNNQIRVDEDFLSYLPILEKIEENEDQIGDFFYVNYGAQISSKEKGAFSKEDVVLEQTTNGNPKFFEGTDVSRYNCNWSGAYLDYRPNEMYGPRDPLLFDSQKIAVSVRTAKNERLSAAYDDTGMYCDHTVILCAPYSDLEGSSLRLEFDGYNRYDEAPNQRYVLAQLNSTLISWFFQNKFATGALQGSYSDVWPASVRGLPVHQPNHDETVANVIRDNKVVKRALDKTELDSKGSIEVVLSIISGNQLDHKSQRNALNLDLLDYLGNYEDGPTLGECYQPASGLAESVLTDTEADSEFAKLRVTAAQVERDDDRLRVLAEPYVKPTDPEEYDTNGRGYATLDPVPAMEFVGLSEAEADLVEAFVPHAVETADGFAGYRDNATATISPLDRLEGLTLPMLADVESGIERYMAAKERAAELDEKIERTDELIDEIVYELYGLTDEEIEIVAEAVGE